MPGGPLAELGVGEGRQCDVVDLDRPLAIELDELDDGPLCPAWDAEGRPIDLPVERAAPVEGSGEAVGTGDLQALLVEEVNLGRRAPAPRRPVPRTATEELDLAEAVDREARAPKGLGPLVVNSRAESDW